MNIYTFKPIHALFAFMLCWGSVHSQELLIAVSDEDTGLPLAFAHIQFRALEIGAFTDLAGRASISAAGSRFLKDSVKISYIGYRDTTLYLDFRGQHNLTIQLKSIPLLLQTAEVLDSRSSLDAEAIVRKAVKMIKANYGKHSVLLKAFYREAFYEEERLVEVNEAIAEIDYTKYPQRWFTKRSFRDYYRAGYEGKPVNRPAENLILLSNPLYFKYYNTVNDRCRIVASRLSANVSEVGLTPHVTAGPLGLLSTDKVKYRADFLDPKVMPRYHFSKSRAAPVNGHDCYIITFRPIPEQQSISQPYNKRVEYPIFSGSLYIDMETFAVVGIRCQLAPEANFGNYQTRHAWQTFPFSTTLSIDYEQAGGCWHLKRLTTRQHVKSGQATARSLAYDYTLVRSLEVYDVEQEGELQIKDEEELLSDRYGNTLSKHANEYNGTLWHDFERLAVYPRLSDSERSSLEAAGALSTQWGRWFEKKGLKPPIAERGSGTLRLDSSTTLSDPFRWMENLDTDATRKYIAAENEYFHNEMINLKRKHLVAYKAIADLVNPCDTAQNKPKDERYAIDFSPDGRYGLIEMDSTQGFERLLIDFDSLPHGQNLHAYKLSPSGGAVAYLTARAPLAYRGFVSRLSPGSALDTLAGDAHELEWLDEHTVLYSVMDFSKRPYACYVYHVGTGEHEPLFETPSTHYELELRRFGSHLLLNCTSSSGNLLFSVSVDSNGRSLLVPVHDERLFSYAFFSKTDTLYFMALDTDRSASLYAWRQGAGLSTVWSAPCAMAPTELLVTSNYILIKAIEQAEVRLLRIAKDSLVIHAVPLPEKHCHVQLGKVVNDQLDQCSFMYESPNQARTQYTLDLRTVQQQMRPIDCISGEAKYTYRTALHTVPSEGGETIPLRISFREDFSSSKGVSKGLLLIVYGAYGAFSESGFDEYHRYLMDQGYHVGHAFVRGSRAKGWRWHTAGSRANKMKAVQDYMACARYARRELDSPKVVAYGLSAGGVIVAAALNQAPTLFDAAVLDYPFLDAIGVMLNDSLHGTRLEYQEWGNPKVEEELNGLLAYSPYQNIKQQPYPPMLILGGLYDFQTPYWQILKSVAMYRAKTQGESKILLHLNRTYHPGWIPYSERMKEMVYQYLFFDGIVTK